MFTAGLNGLAIVHTAFFGFLEVVERDAMGMLGTTLELVVFCALVWALLGSRTNVRRNNRGQGSGVRDRESVAQRLRARQKELTLK